MIIETTPFDCVTAIEQACERVEPPRATKTGNARLCILLGPDEGHSYGVDRECLIGRGVGSAIRLGDPGVSRRHARVQRKADGRFVIEDLGSRNGLWVDGERTSRCELRSGSKIQLGPRCLLLFTQQDAVEKALIDAQKVEIIGRLSAGINHDFNNLLCVILANAAHLLELPQRLPLDHAEVRECLEDMRAAAQAGADVTTRLAMLAQKGTLPQEHVDLSALCADVIEIMRETFPKSIRIHAKIHPGISVRGVRSHLRQLLLHPCLNARDAMPEGGTLSVELTLKSEVELSADPMMKAERYAVVTVRDNGTGMSAEVLHNAFEPFFTTKEISLGRGLGLVSVRKVASEHGGSAELHSKLGEGTTLRIVLPVGDGLASRATSLTPE